jgi:hypothetical protein
VETWIVARHAYRITPMLDAASPEFERRHHGFTGSVRQIKASARLPFHRLCRRGPCLGLHRVAAGLAGLRVVAVMPAVQGLLAAALAKEVLPAALVRDGRRCLDHVGRASTVAVGRGVRQAVRGAIPVAEAASVQDVAPRHRAPAAR